MKKALAILSLVTVSAIGARADVVAAWDVAGHGTPFDSTLNATTVSGDVTGTPALSRTGLTGSGASNSFSSTTWNNTATFDSTNKYIGFSLTAANAITLTDLQYAINGSNTAPGTGEWGFSVNGGAFTFEPTFTLANAAPSSLADWDFNDFSLNAGDSVEFRFWAWGTTAINSTAAAASTGTVRIANLTSGNDLVLNGTAAAVPEPTTIGLIGLGLAGVVAFVRRRKA